MVRKAVSMPFLEALQGYENIGSNAALQIPLAGGLAGVAGLIDLFTGDQKAWNSGEALANPLMTAGVVGAGIGTSMGYKAMNDMVYNRDPVAANQRYLDANPNLAYNPDRPTSTVAGARKSGNHAALKRADQAASQLLAMRRGRNAAIAGAGAAALAGIGGIFHMMNDKPQDQPQNVYMAGVPGGVA